MELLNKPMSDFWKSTKEAFAEIMDMHDSVIGGGKRQPQPQRPGTAAEGSGPGGSTEGNGTHDDDGSSLQQTTTATVDTGSVNQETAKPHRENPQVHQKHSSKTRRPLSTREGIQKKEYDPPSETVPHSSHHARNQPKEQSARNSLNATFGKFWKDIRTFNVNPASNSGSKLTKSETATTKKTHHGKSKPTFLHSKELKTAHATGDTEIQVLRSHRTHSQSRSRQGSQSDSLHFRSNSTDRASVMKYKEAVQRSRPFLRSASDDAMQSDQGMEHDEEEDTEDVSAEKMKTKILSMWNNVRYGWTVKTRTAFSLAKPIWILGKHFQHSVEDAEVQLPGLEAVKSPAMERFKREFSSRIWLTYRREFPQLAGSSYTTDCGWGCMLRSGQMMLAQALVQHFLGRDWNYYNEQTKEQQRYHHEIVRWFGDQPDDMSPFSLHRLVEIGKSSGKKAGDWYGPASVAHIFKEAMDHAMELNPLLEQVCIYVAQDCTIYKEDVINLCKRKRPGSLQPVYSDHSSPKASLSVVTPPSSSSHQKQTPTNPEAADTLSTSAVVHKPDFNSSVTDSDAEKGPQSLQQMQQSSQTDLPHSSELNGNATHTTHLPSAFPTNSHPVDATHEPTLTGPKPPSTSSHPPPVATKPKMAHRIHWTENGQKPDEPPPSPEAEDTQTWIQMRDVGHQPDSEPVTPPSMTQDDTPKEEGDKSSTWCAVVILVPVRLGGDEVNPIYISSVQHLFTLPSCIGIIGGKPKHSLYYLGFQEEKLIHLDPHYCQPVVDMKTREFPLSSFHCMSPRKMAITKMDPSCTIGFYLRTEKDFHDFCDIIPSIVQGPMTSNSSRDYPMFILRNGCCSDFNSQQSTNEQKPERLLRVRHVNQNGQLIAPVRETEDFVFLDS